MANAIVRDKKLLTIAVVDDSPTHQNRLAGTSDAPPDFFATEAVDSILSMLNEYEDIAGSLVYSEDFLEAFVSGRAPKFDGIINLSNGFGGRFQCAHMPLLFEFLKQDYHGGNPFQLLLFRDKYRTKVIAEKSGIKTPPYLFLDENHLGLVGDVNQALFPAVLKPNEEGVGKGLSPEPITSKSELSIAARSLLSEFPAGVLVEHFVAGEELTVACLGIDGEYEAWAYILRNVDGSRLPPHHMNTTDNLDRLLYEDAFRWIRVDSLYGSEVEELALDKTLRLVRCLEIPGYVRADFRYVPETGELWFLELNGQAGLSLGSSVIREIGLDNFGREDGFLRKFVDLYVQHTRYAVSAVGA